MVERMVSDVSKDLIAFEALETTGQLTQYHIPENVNLLLAC
jgi:hypothetical protein